MTEAEYKSRLHEIDQRYEKERMDLMAEYAISKTDIKIGDIVGDKEKMIIVDEIGVTRWGIPSIYYIGRKVNKNGKVSKKADKYNVFSVIYHIVKG